MATIHNSSENHSQRSRIYPYPLINPGLKTRQQIERVKGIDFSASTGMFFNPLPITPQKIQTIANQTIMPLSNVVNPITKKAFLPNYDKAMNFNSSLPTKPTYYSQDQTEPKSNINWLLEIYRRRVELYQRQLDEQRSLLLQVFFYNKI